MSLERFSQIFIVTDGDKIGETFNFVSNLKHKLLIFQIETNFLSQKHVESFWFLCAPC